MLVLVELPQSVSIRLINFVALLELAIFFILPKLVEFFVLLKLIESTAAIAQNSKIE